MELCDGLPLGVEIASALLVDDFALPVNELVEDLEQARLPRLTRRDASVAAVPPPSW
ncbi:hypothetical protein [Saccharopolyspora shandongensis]|uniref:hypothetical protein n=1 Tax=Saccharopolyspora shandongensis TaxID=418495 RepID=UPI0033F8C721